MHRIFEHRAPMSQHIGPQATIKHDPDVRGTFLLIFVAEQLLIVPGAYPPINGARGVPRLVGSYPEEFNAGPGGAGGNATGVHSRATGTNGDTSKAVYRREHEKLARSRHTDPAFQDS